MGGVSAVRAGQSGEISAESYVVDRLGLRVLARNFRSRVGELDIVALDADQHTLVIIEVKAYRKNAFVSAESAITPKKLYRLSRTTEFFLLRYPQFQQHFIRIDLIIVENGQVKSHYLNVRL